MSRFFKWLTLLDILSAFLSVAIHTYFLRASANEKKTTMSSLDIRLCRHFVFFPSFLRYKYRSRRSAARTVDHNTVSKWYNRTRGMYTSMFSIESLTMMSIWIIPREPYESVGMSLAFPLFTNLHSCPWAVVSTRVCPVVKVSFDSSHLMIWRHWSRASQYPSFWLYRSSPQFIQRIPITSQLIIDRYRQKYLSSSDITSFSIWDSHSMQGNCSRYRSPSTEVEQIMRSNFWQKSDDVLLFH
jgi:hypothetical protein